MVERSAVKRPLYTPISLIWRHIRAFGVLTYFSILYPLLYPKDGSPIGARIKLPPTRRPGFPFKSPGLFLPLANDADLEAEGQAEKIAGIIQSKIGQVKKALGT